MMANLLPLIYLQIGSVFARFREPRKCGILSVLGNPGGEPRPGPSDPDEEYRANARIRRRRRKHVVNAKIAIHFKRDACKICAVWDIPVICAAQRRKNARVAVASDGIAAPRRRPRPSTRMLPSCFTSAARSRITQIWPAAATPRTVVFVEPVEISPIPSLNLTKFWGQGRLSNGSHDEN